MNRASALHAVDPSQFVVCHTTYPCLRAKPSFVDSTKFAKLVLLLSLLTNHRPLLYLPSANTYAFSFFYNLSNISHVTNLAIFKGHIYYLGIFVFPFAFVHTTSCSGNKMFKR